MPLFAVSMLRARRIDWFLVVMLRLSKFLMAAVVFQVKSQQAEVIRILDSKSIQYELIDISVGGELRDEMRIKAGDPTAVPPQLFNEDQYCGVRKAHTHVPHCFDCKSLQQSSRKMI